MITGLIRDRRSSDPLVVEPKPLFLQDGRIAVLWSMKSGCTHVVSWAFACEGLLQAARYYHNWPHKFRLQVYEKSRGYLAARENFETNAFGARTVLQFTRDPAKRVVSVFRHVCKHDTFWGKIRRDIGVNVARDGLSLEEFDRFLGGRDIVAPTRTNPHICAQRHPINGMDIDRIVTVNMDTHDLDDSLMRIEAAFGLHVDHDVLAGTVKKVSSFHYAEKVDNARFKGDIERVKIRQADTDVFPKDRLQASPLVAEMAARHYAVDMDIVPTRDTAGELFTVGEA